MSLNSTSTTGPMTWTTRPILSFAWSFVMGFSAWLLLGHRVDGRHYLQQLLGDRGLADLVQAEDQITDELLGGFSRIFHGHHPGRLFGRLRLEIGMKDLGFQVEFEQRLEHGAGGRVP